MLDVEGKGAKGQVVPINNQLDLGRLGIQPRPERLCTTSSQDPEMIHWGYERE